MAKGGRAKGSKTALLLRLLAAIDEGRHGFEALKERVDDEDPPSTRSLRRYLADLEAAGFPWRFDRATGVYRFDRGYSLRKLRLSGDELFGLSTLAGIATSLGGDIGEAMVEVAGRLAQIADRPATGAAGSPAVQVQLAGPRLDPERRAIFKTLRRAQFDHQSVRFTYVDKRARRSRRHVDPYGFVVSGGRIYLVAHDRRRGAKRVFALDGISGARIAPQRFSVPDDFNIEAFAARSVSGIMHGDEAVEVTVRFSPVVARAAIAERVVRERTIDQRPDGSVEIAYTVVDPSEFVRWAMKWGAEAEILKPGAARAQAAELAEAIVARYKR